MKRPASTSSVLALQERLENAGVAVVRNGRFDKLSAGHFLQFQDPSANTIRVTTTPA